MLPPKDTIKTLNLTITGDHPPTTQFFLRHTLERFALHPTSLNPSSILVVRSINRTIPAKLFANKNFSSTERPLQLAVTDHLRMAVRPQQGAIDPRAQAVLFTDYSELLACLACACFHNTRGSAWWWKTLNAQAADYRHPLEPLLAHPPLIGPSLTRLWEWPDGPVIIREAESRIIDELLIRMESVYKTGITADALDEDTPGAGAGAMHEPDERDSIPTSPATPSRAPWENLITRHDTSTLTPRQELLVGVALSVTTSTSTVSTPWFFGQVLRWWRSRNPRDRQTIAQRERAKETGIPVLPSGKERDTAGDGVTSIPDTNADVPELAPATVRLEQTGTTRNLEQSENIPHHADRSPELPTDTSQPHTDTSGGTDEADVVSRPPGSPVQLDEGLLHESTPGTAQPTPDSPVSQLAFHFGETPLEGIETHYAGLFYLINLITTLKFREQSHTIGWEHISGMSVWHILDNLARSLCDERVNTDDPVWLLLEQLCFSFGEDQADAGAVNPSTYRLPLYWWRRFTGVSGPDHQPCYYWYGTDSGDIPSDERQDLFVSYKNLFLLGYDPCITRDATHFSHAETIAQPYFATPPTTPHGTNDLPPLIHTPASRADTPPNPTSWWACILPFCRQYLNQLLSHHSPSPHRVPSPHSLITRPGIIYATRCHVDVVMNLNDIDLAIRIAGLDQDPGWNPDFGRVIQFHFE